MRLYKSYRDPSLSITLPDGKRLLFKGFALSLEEDWSIILAQGPHKDNYVIRSVFDLLDRGSMSSSEFYRVEVEVGERDAPALITDDAINSLTDYYEEEGE